MVYASPAVHRHPRHVHADRRRTSRSTSSCAAARSTSGQLLEVITAFLVGPQAGHPRHQRVHRVQAPRPDLRHGRRRHAVPGPGHARRLRRAVPGGQPRLLRLLRPDDRRQPARADPAAARVRHEPTATSTGCSRRSTSPRPASPTGDAAMTPSQQAAAGQLRWPGSRARARCEVASSDGEVSAGRAADLRTAAVLRGVPARARSTPRSPTSPRGSAGSARSPTRPARGRRSRTRAASIVDPPHR